MTRPFNTSSNGRKVNLALRRFGRLRLAIGLALLAVLLLPLAGAPVYADANDFVVNSFKADYTLTNKDPQGELHINERIRVNFSAANHGILRAIPTSYKKHRLQITINSVKSDSGAPAEYTTYGDHGNKVLKIGNPDKTVTGYQEYTIDYTVHNVISFYKDHDELYWDINGDQWSQQIDKVELMLHLPQDARAPTAANCYTGSYGVNARDCGILYDQTQQAIEASTSQALLPKETSDDRCRL